MNRAHHPPARPAPSCAHSPSASVPRSWYFVARSRDLAGAGARHESVVADRLLELQRGGDGALRGRLGGAPVELHEQGSLIYAWLGGGRPSFELQPVGEQGWTPMKLFFLDLPTRPEQVMRDLADLEHFAAVHRYVDIEVEQGLRCEGAVCSTSIAFGWDTGIAGRSFAAKFSSRAEGLGRQRTEVESLGGLLRSRHLVMPTPRLGSTTRVWAGYSVEYGRGPKALRELVARSLAAYLGWAFRRDLGRDAQLWTGASAYQPADSEVLRRFGDWTQQFMPRLGSAEEGSVAWRSS